MAGRVRFGARRAGITPRDAWRGTGSEESDILVRSSGAESRLNSVFTACPCCDQWPWFNGRTRFAIPRHLLSTTTLLKGRVGRVITIRNTDRYRFVKLCLNDCHC